MAQKLRNLLGGMLILASAATHAQDPVSGPRKITPSVYWDQYPTYLGANRAFMLTPINTSTWTPAGNWGTYRPISFDGPTSTFMGWDGTQWVPFAAKQEKWYYYNSASGTSTAPIATLVNATISGRVYVDGVEYRPAPSGTPGDKEYTFNATTGVLSFDHALVSCNHVDVPYFGGSAGPSSNADASCAAIRLAPTTLPDATVGISYSQNIPIIAGTGPITLAGIVKPSWMTVAVSGNNITLVGTPNASGQGVVSFNATNCNCYVASYSGTFVVSLACQPVQFANTNLPDGIVGSAYSTSVAMTGTAPITLSSITKPNWMTITQAGSSLVFSGTPDSQGSSVPVSVTATNCNGQSAVYSKTIAITAACVPAYIAATPMPDGTVGAAYSQTLQLQGTAPFTLSNIIKPSWMTVSLSGNTITASGTPNAVTTTGGAAVGFWATNCTNQTATYFQTFTIASACTPVAIATTGIDNGKVGVAYNQTVFLTGTAPFSLTGVVKPSWMTIVLSGSTVSLQGTPTAVASSVPVSFGVQNCTSSSATFSDIIAVLSNPTLAQTSNTTTGPGGTRTQVFSVGSVINAGDSYSLQVYSHPVTVVAVSGDTPTTMALKLANAINATTAAQWNDHGSAPASGTNGFKPTATSSGSSVTIVLNYVNQFAANAY